MRNIKQYIDRYDYDVIKSVIDGVEETTRKYEAKWGVGRLELLVPDELREKFRRQLRRFNEAITVHDPVKVRLSGNAMRRGWEALDQAATESGALPLDPEIWEIRLSTGKVVALCRTRADAFAAFREGRYVDVWTPDEIARLIENFPDIVLAKETFPGALIASARPKSLPVSESDDYYPDMLEAAADE